VAARLPSATTATRSRICHCSGTAEELPPLGPLALLLACADEDEDAFPTPAVEALSLSQQTRKRGKHLLYRTRRAEPA
jgi:hypothetical protein